MPKASNEQHLLSQFLRYVTTDSPSLREGRFAALVQTAMRQTGISGMAASFDRPPKQLGGQTGNLIARVPGAAPGPTLLLSAHLDTVMSNAGIKPRVSGGVVTAGGAPILGADDKAAVACIVEALRVIHERKVLHPPLEIVFTFGEEIGLLGVRQLNLRSLRAKLGFVFDSNGPVGEIVARAPSHDRLRATITGVPAHAGANPEAGVSAIQIAARAIARMRLGRIDRLTTANIGVIQGGRATNIIPECVELRGEARSHDPARLSRQVQHMCECLHQAATELQGGIEVEVERQYESFHLTRSNQVVKLAMAAARQAGVEPRLVASGGGSDANILNARGIASVVMAVGYHEPHSRNESIPVAELSRLTNLIVALVQLAAKR